MSQLPGWVDRGEMALDTQFDESGRWVSSPCNEAAIPNLTTEPRDVVIRDEYAALGRQHTGRL